MLSLIISSLSFVVALVAAGITGYQVYVAKDQEVRQLRSYVGPTGFQLVKLDSTNHLYLKVIWHNFGSTPALRFDFTWHSNTELKSASSIYPTGNRDSDGAEGAVIYPNSESNWYTDFVLTQFPDEFFSDRRVITFYGTAFYRDTFGGSHSTPFCFFVTRDNANDLKHSNDVYPKNCNNAILPD